MATMRFQVGTHVQKDVASFMPPLRKNEMEDPPYIETYIKIYLISDPLTYNLSSKYCRNSFKTSAKARFLCMYFNAAVYLVAFSSVRPYLWRLF